MAPWLRAPVLAEGLDSVPSTHIAVHNLHNATTVTPVSVDRTSSNCHRYKADM